MKKCFNSLLSYTLSVVSGLFLVSGIAVLSAGGEWTWRDLQTWCP